MLKTNPAHLLSVFPLCLPSPLPLPLIHHWQNVGDGCLITSLTAFLFSPANQGGERDNLPLPVVSAVSICSIFTFPMALLHRDPFIYLMLLYACGKHE